MDAPPPDESVIEFIQIDHYLAGLGLHVPQIEAIDELNGFLILEDLGDLPFGLAIKEPHNFDELTLYQGAVDVLCVLHQGAPLASCSGLGNQQLLKDLAQLTDWYLPSLLKRRLTESELKQFHDLWMPLFDVCRILPAVTVLRDYHSPNLMWLPHLEGLNRVGVIDFQDAVIGSPAFDLVSLLEDARLDLQPQTEGILLSHYCSQMSGLSKEQLYLEYTIFGVQRNLKILGFACRKLMNEQNRNYLHLIPRMWRYLTRDLEHPNMAELKRWLDDLLPVTSRPLDILINRYEEANHG